MGKGVYFRSDVPKYGIICMASEHPKITSYIPRAILEVLDKWKEEQELDSRNEGIVAILADYLGVQHPLQLHWLSLPSKVADPIFPPI